MRKGAKTDKDIIVQKEQAVLHEHARTLLLDEIYSPKIQALIADMKCALAREEHGVGLAAPQVGVGVRLFIVAGSVFAKDDEDEGEDGDAETTSKRAKSTTPPDRVFINPEIIRMSRTRSQMDEGCLSVRGYYGSVLRNDKATVRALDEHGKQFTLGGSGLLAQIFQHEIDHLNGVLYIDKAISVSPEKKDKPTEKEKKPSPRS